jgi:hypothetical protein
LIVDNSFGGLGHAIPMAALEQGELEVYFAQRSNSRGHLKAGGEKTELTADPVMAQRWVTDMTEFLPALLE